ncbi:MAG: mgtE [Rickettsiaceae bacterium]|jgi:magnesium transporter|nr:mgtE [Rickettsiaceae bacterium]
MRKAKHRHDQAADQNNHSYLLSHEQSKELMRALEADDRVKITELVTPLHAADIADFINMASYEHRRLLINFIRRDFDPEILVELSQDAKEGVLELLGPERSAMAINTLETDDAVDVMEDLNKEEQEEILSVLPEEDRKDLEESLSYPQDSAGRMVDRNVVSVPEFWTVGQTIDFLRSEKDLPDEFYEIFVVDPKMKPVGGIMLSRIMRSKRPVMVKDIMQTDLKLIKSGMDQEEVAFLFRQYGLASAPVINEEGRMIGVITVDDVVDVIEEEAQEDIMYLGGVTETDLHSSPTKTIKRRFPWLFANLVTAVSSSFVISMFEGTIAKIAALAVLMPVAASMGGNAGMQTTTVIVRSIATKELTTTNAMRVISKELMVGLLNGISFSIIAATVSYLVFGNLLMSAAFGLAIIATLFMAGLLGVLIPLAFVKLGADPAIASNVVLTTITDCTAFATFLGIATWLLVN